MKSEICVAKEYIDNITRRLSLWMFLTILGLWIVFDKIDVTAPFLNICDLFFSIEEKDLDYSYVEINPYEVDERLPGAMEWWNIFPQMEKPRKALAEVAFGKTHQKRAPNFRLLSWFERCFSLDGLFMTIQDDTDRWRRRRRQLTRTEHIWSLVHPASPRVCSSKPYPYSFIFNGTFSLASLTSEKWSGFRIHIIVKLRFTSDAPRVSLASTTEKPCSRHFCEQVAIPKNNSR